MNRSGPRPARVTRGGSLSNGRTRRLSAVTAGQVVIDAGYWLRNYVHGPMSFQGYIPLGKSAPDPHGPRQSAPVVVVYPDHDPAFPELFAIPLTVVFSSVLATVVVGLANLTAFAIDLSASLIGARTDLATRMWSGSPELFAAIWIGVTVSAVMSSDQHRHY